MNRYVALLLVCAALALGVAPVPGARAADAPAGNSAFLRTWARTDKAVADQRTSRTWMWGPQANTPLLLEPYSESPDGLRVVQYFDKSRMEITQPSGDPATPWYVTNGLLATELITGRMQVGDASFQQRAPAEVNVAGDGDDPYGPTYATFGRLPAGAAHGEEAVVTRGLRRDGSVFNDERFAQYAIGTTHFTAETGYWIATPFWEFMNSSGLVYASGFYSTAALFENPYYATGFPISAAYWADVRVGGVERAVLVQCFERRCLTYTPGNPPGFATEAGNVGLHYYLWRYAAESPVLAPPPDPEPAPGIPAQVAWSQVLAQGDVPAARQDHVLVATSAGTRVYLHGGRSGGTVLGDLWVFDSEVNQWARLSPTGPVPAARFGHNAVYDPAGQRLLLFGGQAASGFLSDIWAYVIAENRWEQLAPNGSGPLDRYGAGGGFDPASGSFYLTHGFTSAGRFDDTWRYAQEQGWQQFAVSGERPEARCLLRSVFDPQGNRLLLFGGQSNSAGFLGDLWAFDLATSTWRRIASPGPSARNLYSWSLRGDTGQAYLFGGATSAGANNSLWVLNLQTDAWSEVTPTGSPPPGRSGHDAVWLESRQGLFVFGGTVAGSERNDIWLATFP